MGGKGNYEKCIRRIQYLAVAVSFISLPLSLIKENKSTFFYIGFALFVLFALTLLSSVAIHWVQTDIRWAGFISRSFRIIGFIFLSFFLTFTPVRQLFTRLFPLFLVAAFVSSVYSIFTQNSRSQGFFSNPAFYSFILCIIIFLVFLFSARN